MDNEPVTETRWQRWGGVASLQIFLFYVWITALDKTDTARAWSIVFATAMELYLVVWVVSIQRKRSR